jgi:hypothetical protein
VTVPLLVSHLEGDAVSGEIITGGPGLNGFGGMMIKRP